MHRQDVNAVALNFIFIRSFSERCNAEVKLEISLQTKCIGILIPPATRFRHLWGLDDIARILLFLRSFFDSINFMAIICCRFLMHIQNLIVCQWPDLCCTRYFVNVEQRNAPNEIGRTVPKSQSSSFLFYFNLQINLQWNRTIIVKV